MVVSQSRNPGLDLPPSQRASSDSFFTRVSVAIQFTSQVLPPSSENACSKRHEFGVMFEITKRTKMDRPLNVPSDNFLSVRICGGLPAPGCFIISTPYYPKLPNNSHRAPAHFSKGVTA